jgi:hypothetical protein
MSRLACSSLIEALNRHRGKGQQKGTVEHVHVHAGGQAVVGMVRGSGGRGWREIRGTTPCEANCPTEKQLVTPQRAKTTASLPPNSRWMNRAGPSDLRAYGHLWGSLLACRRRGPLSGRTCPHVLAPCRSYPGNNFVIASQHARELCRAQNLGPQRSSGTTASHINGPDCTLTDLKSLGCVGNDRLHLLAPLPSHGHVSCNSGVKRVL